jgi:hypothetical protein
MMDFVEPVNYLNPMTVIHVTRETFDLVVLLSTAQVNDDGSDLRKRTIPESTF